MPHLATDSPSDRLRRPLRELRVSITDRCNLRCRYCMPSEQFGPDHPFLPNDRLMSVAQIEAVTRQAVALGVNKVRITGGEPLARGDLPAIIDALRALDGITDLSLITNAVLLTAPRARALRDAGLDRLTISLDALDDERFHQVTGTPVPVSRVLDGIAHAADAGFDSLKINMVVKRGLNDDQVLPMARRFRNSGHIVRFIEYMDVGSCNGWIHDDVVSADEIRATIHAHHPIEALPPRYPGEVAKRWRYRDGGGEIGFITSVSQPFCGDCNRLRLSADGRLYTCLFAARGLDITPWLRPAIDTPGLYRALMKLWSNRHDRYSEQRHESVAVEPPIEMSYIGG